MQPELRFSLSTDLSIIEYFVEFLVQIRMIAFWFRIIAYGWYQTDFLAGNGNSSRTFAPNSCIKLNTHNYAMPYLKYSTKSAPSLLFGKSNPISSHSRPEIFSHCIFDMFNVPAFSQAMNPPNIAHTLSSVSAWKMALSDNLPESLLSLYKS